MKRRLYTAGFILAFATIYFFAGRFGLSLAYMNASVSPVWPPTGIALAALLLWGYGLWPGIFVGAFFVNLTTQGTLLTSLGIATGNTLEALVGAWLVNQFAGGRGAFEQARDIFKFILLAVIASPVVSATLGVTTLALGGFAPWQNFVPTWTTWWSGDAMGALIVAPLILIWRGLPLSRGDYRGLLEAVLIFAGILLAGLIAYGGLLNESNSRYVRYLIYPAALCAAYRYGPRGAISAVFMISCVAVWGTLHHYGPFAMADRNQSLVFLQTYLGAFTMTNLILGALVSERQRAEEALKQMHRKLEWRVFDKTAELIRADESLRSEVEARKQTELAHDQLAAIVEYSTDAILSKTLDGVITSWNKGAEQMLGYTAAEIVGGSITTLVPADQIDELEQILERIQRQEAVEPVETMRIRKDGRAVEVSLTLSPIRDETGRITGASAIMRDISERKRLEAEILAVSEREQRRIAEDLHDGLGQQLGGISCLCDVLKKSLNEQASPEAAAAAKISRLLNDAVAQTRSLARGLHPVALETNGLMAAFEDMASRVTDLFKVTCHFTCPRPVLIGDNAVASHLYRITQEAITNAIKHGRAQRIEIGLSSTPERITLTVSDDGIGFKPVARQREGLGLRIMNHRAEVIGGTLSVRRRAAGGTEVVCSVHAANGEVVRKLEK